jgi:hypothetical protein
MHNTPSTSGGQERRVKVHVRYVELGLNAVELLHHLQVRNLHVLQNL